MKKWQSYCEKQSYTKSIEYFIDLYGEEEGKNKFNEINLKKLLTKENFIRKYGEEKGNDRWNEFIKNCTSPYSKISQEYFKKIADKNEKNHEIYFGNNEFKFKMSRI